MLQALDFRRCLQIQGLVWHEFFISQLYLVSGLEAGFSLRKGGTKHYETTVLIGVERTVLKTLCRWSRAKEGLRRHCIVADPVDGKRCFGRTVM